MVDYLLSWSIKMMQIMLNDMHFVAQFTMPNGLSESASFLSEARIRRLKHPNILTKTVWKTAVLRRELRIRILSPRTTRRDPERFQGEPCTFHPRRCAFGTPCRRRSSQRPCTRYHLSRKIKINRLTSLSVRSVHHSNPALHPEYVCN